jgi:hypothetical protein
VVVFEVPGDGVCAGVKACVGELGSYANDQFNY